MGRNYLTLSLLLFVLCTGCQVGPDYERPCVEMPPRFVEERGKGEDEAPLATFWEQFNDPVLDDLIETAVCANFDLRGSLERVEEVRARYRIKSADLWPQVDAIGEVNRSRTSQNLIDAPFLSPEFKNFFQVGFDAVWELDLFGRLRRSKEAAFAQLQASCEAARAVRVLVVSEAATLYVDVRRIQKRQMIAGTRVELMKRELALVYDQYHAGLIDKVGVELRREALRRAQAFLVTLESSLKERVYALGLLVAKQPEEMEPLLTSIGGIPDAKGRLFGEMPCDLLRRRPDIRQAERELARATAEIGVAVADLFPTFSLLGSFRYESNHSSNWFNPPSKAWQIGPTLRWPVLDFGRIRAQIDVRKAIERQALLNYEKGILAALQEVESRFVFYFNEEIEVGLKESELEAAARASALVWDRSFSGLVSEVEAIQSALRTLEIEEELALKQGELGTHLIAVYKALGGGW